MIRSRCVHMDQLGPALSPPMNKAFVRDPDPPDPRCPACGGHGQSVGAATLEAHLHAPARQLLSASAFFCPNPKCHVAYFDATGIDVAADMLRTRCYPKHDDAPICPCHDVMADDIIADARSGNPARVRDLIARATAPGARCSLASPSGQSCVEQVQRLYLRHLKR